MAKYIAETVHKLTQVVEQDNTSIQKARKTIEDIKSKSEEQIRDVYKTQDKFTKLTTDLKLSAYKNDSKYFKAASTEKAKIIRENTRAQVASIEYVTDKQIALYKEEIAWLKRLDVQQKNTRLGTTSGGRATASTANAGGSSTQGNLGLGGQVKTLIIGKPSVEYKKMLDEAYAADAQFTKGINANNKSRADTRTQYYKQYRRQRLQSNKGEKAVSRQRQKDLADQRRALKATSTAQKEATQTITQSATATKELTANTHGLFSTMKRALITVPAFYGVAKAIMTVHEAITSLGKEFVRFDQSIFTLKAVLNLKTVQDAETLAKAVENLGIKYGGAFEEIEKGMLTLGRAGVDSVNELVKATETLNQLSLLTGDSLDEGAAAVATLLNVYPQLSDEIENLGNKMGFVANATRLGLADFSTISNYALTTAKSLNITSDSYLALTGAMSKVGLNASTIGTSIRRLKKLTDDDNKETIEFFRILGISQKDFAKNIRDDSAKALTKFSRALSVLPIERYSKATKGLDILVKGMVDTFKQIGAQDHLAKMLKGIQEEQYNLEEQTKSMTVGITKAYEKVRNSFMSMFNDEAKKTFDAFFDRTNVEAFDKSVKDAVTTLRDIIPTLDQIKTIGFGLVIYNITKYLTTATIAAGGLTKALVAVRLAMLSIAALPMVIAAGITGVALLAKEAYGYQQIVQNGGYRDEETRLKAIQGMANQGTALAELGQRHKDVTNEIISLEQAKNKVIEFGATEGKQLTIDSIDAQIFKLNEIKDKVTELKAGYATDNVLKSGIDLGNDFNIDRVLKAQEESSDSYGEVLVSNTEKVQKAQRAARAEFEKANGTYDKRKWILEDIITLEKEYAVAKATANNTASEENMIAEAKALEELSKKRQALLALDQRTANKPTKTNDASNADRDAGIRIQQLLKEAELKNTLLKQEYALQGIILSNYQKDKMSLDLAKAAATQSTIAYKAALKEKTLKTGPRTDLKILDAQLKMEKAKLKLYLEQNKVALETARSMKSAGDAMFDSLLEGDLEGAMKGMLSDVADLFIEPLKDSFSTLFGDTMGELMSPMVDGFKAILNEYLTTTIATNEAVSVASIATSQAEAVAAVPGAVAKSGAQGGYVGAIAMIALLAAYGLAGSGGSTVSQAEIDASKGRSEYDDESLGNLTEMFEDAQYPMLEVTNKMYKSIRSMDENFFAIARAFSSQASQGGVDLTGANFVDGETSSFLGFNSSTVSLIGTGLLFAAQSLGDMMELSLNEVLSYTTSLETKSKAWGFSTSEKIREAYATLPQPVIDDLADNFASAYGLLLTAGVELGFDEAALSQQLSAAEIDLGKIDFTGLSPEEVNQRLSDAFSTAFSAVAEQIPVFTELIDRYTKGTEQALETLGRLAVEYNQASYSFGLIGKNFADVDNRTIQTSLESIPIIGSMFIDTYEEAAKALTDSGFAVNYENLMLVWGTTVSGVIGYTTETVNRLVGDVYTAQEQILDIVASTGGLNEFQDAMSSFISGFYSEEEQAAYLRNSIETAFGTMGLTDAGYIVPQTNDEFRTLLETMDTTTEEGAYLYGQVLLLSEGFAAMTESSEVLLTTLTDTALAMQYTSASTDFTARSIALTGDEGAIAEYAVTAARLMLEAVQADTGLSDAIDLTNFEDYFQAMNDLGALTADELEKWEMLGDAIMTLEEAEQAFIDFEDSINDLITTLNDATLYIDYLSGTQDFETRTLSLSGADETAMAAYAITASEEMLKAVELQTELSGITVDNYLEQLALAHLNNTLSSEQLDSWQTLGDALLSVEEATKTYADLILEEEQRLADERLVIAEELAASTAAATKALADAWLGNLSYLTLAQKADFATGYLAIANDSDGTISSLDAAKAAAEIAIASTTTKEDYIPAFERYITALEAEIPESTLDDVVVKLDALIDEVVLLQDKTTDSAIYA